MRLIIKFILCIAITLIAMMPRLSAAKDTITADEVRLRLAVAFEKNDMATVRSLVSDPWSGLRFFTTRQDGMWERAAVAFHNAQLVTKNEKQVVYEINWPVNAESKKTRTIIFLSLNSEWKLDLNSFLGPFPHF
jgi:hypothetical protein